MNTREKGRYGENAAAEHLLAIGCTIVSRNFQSRYGEIDCVVEDPDGTLVFVEVKAARDMSRGHPFSWVTPQKQRKLAGMARRYLADHGMSSCPCRFDVIAIVGGKLEHMKNAFLA